MRKLFLTSALVLLMATQAVAAITTVIDFETPAAWNNPDGPYFAPIPPDPPSTFWAPVTTMGNPAYGYDGVIYDDDHRLMSNDYTVPDSLDGDQFAGFAPGVGGTGGGIFFMVPEGNKITGFKFDIVKASEAWPTMAGILFFPDNDPEDEIQGLVFGLLISDEWTHHTIDWPDHLEPSWVSLATLTHGSNFALDNISITWEPMSTPEVPIPASLFLLSSGLIPIIRRRIRK